MTITNDNEYGWDSMTDCITITVSREDAYTLAGPANNDDHLHDNLGEVIHFIAEMKRRDNPLPTAEDVNKYGWDEAARRKVTEAPRAPALACPWPDCGGTVTDIVVHLPRVRHHEQQAKGKWEWWIEEGSDDVSVDYFVECSAGERHHYDEDDVPEVITAITDEAYSESHR